MMRLSVMSGFNYIKKVLDELTSVEDIGMLVDNDSLDLRKLVEGSIVEAVYQSHVASPPVLLDGKIGVPGVDYEMTTKDSIADITMLKPTLRIASVLMSDSDRPVTTPVPEDSPEGRMQLNSFIRGTYDDPVLVERKVPAGERMPRYRYYSLAKDSTIEPPKVTVELEYIPYPELVEGCVEISPKLEYPTLDMLASIVLSYLGENEKSDMYSNKALKMMEV